MRVVATQRMMPHFERELLAKRTEEIKRTLNALRGYAPIMMPDLAAQFVKEDYLPALYRSLYLNVGVANAKATFNDFSERKADDSLWRLAMIRFVEEFSGAKISLVTGTLKDFLRETLQEILIDMPTIGIEAQTRYIYEKVLDAWTDVKRWQVRRIVQTESMEAMMVGQYEAMQELGVSYQKVWTATFNNTRPQHEAMDGATVGQDELFVLPNGDKMLYPHDSTHGASAGNLINCACGTYDIPI